LLAITGTIAGLVALLSFKSHSATTTATPALPSAGAPQTAPSGSTGSSATPSGNGSTRSFTGRAITTQYGVVQVKVTVAGTKITNVSFVQLTAFDQRSQEINQQAAPTLLQQSLSAQSANIDGVSGATFTSDGYEQSLQSALDQAGI
jgi:uncharacterized protein with FMN-binding domain